MTPGEMADRLDAAASNRLAFYSRTHVQAAAAMLREAEGLLSRSMPAHVPGSTFTVQWYADRDTWLEGTP